ncbi:MAG TPA: efflux RND transporter permease subunit [Polyangiales bacterium]|nr:efflux RND transporter permease subunit [Polyangiales bacterium]
MTLTDFSLRNRTLIIVLTLGTLYAGFQSFNGLPRLEDPEFTIKEALVVTPYPGATPYEVEEEVSDELELAIQKLGKIERIESRNIPGSSTITVEMRSTVPGKALPQIWDELRRKVGDAQSKLPPGAGPSLVIDDYSDVYGVFLALHGDEYSYRELYDVAKMLRKELALVEDVANVEFFGVVQEAVYIEFDRQRLSQIGISTQLIADQLVAEGIVVDAGKVRAGPEYLEIQPESLIDSSQDLGGVLISKGDGSQVRLRDIANIKRGYQEPASNKLHMDGHEAIGIGISTESGGNVVTMGEGVKRRLVELERQIPLGMDIGVIYMQSDMVVTAIDAFLINLVEAVAIVVVVLLLFMGLRSGLIIGFVLVLTIAATFIFMGPAGVALERISLGALIIALGMLVDNAIVIIDGMLTRIKSGMDAEAAARDIAAQTSMPLLGATAVAIIAFAAIGLSPDSTGEFCRSLFVVIAISLSLSWVTAMTITPLMGIWFLKPPKPSEGNQKKDPYDNALFNGYKKFLDLCLRFRWVTVAVVFGIFLLSLYGFQFTDKSFFPASTTPMFRVDVYWAIDQHIDETEARAVVIEKGLSELEGVTHVASSIGQGPLRFMLTFSPEKQHGGYAQFLVQIEDYRTLQRDIERAEKYVLSMAPNTISYGRTFDLGPSPPGKIEARLVGPDVDVLRDLEQQVLAVMKADHDTKGSRGRWFERVKVIRPRLSEEQADAHGITTVMVGEAIQSTFEGQVVGVYREEDEVIPVLFRQPAPLRLDVANLPQIPIWSPVAQRYIPLANVVTGLETHFSDAVVERRNRKRTLTVVTDPTNDSAPTLWNRLAPKIEALPFPPGYHVEWGGEYESTVEAQAALLAPIPMFVGIMILIVVGLFNAIRQPLVIWLAVPLAVIGVTGGLLLSNQPFGFMALLGFLSLSGMLIKNAIVLVDEMDTQVRQGKPTYDAILDSGVSRLTPVAMAAATTVLGMIPLFTDAFYIAMAVTIVGGLVVATVLTMIVVPTFYAILFNAKRDAGGTARGTGSEDAQAASTAPA